MYTQFFVNTIKPLRLPRDHRKVSYLSQNTFSVSQHKMPLSTHIHDDMVVGYWTRSDVIISSRNNSCALSLCNKNSPMRIENLLENKMTL